MTREFASINVSIRKDKDWRALPAVAQQLYWTLWAHPDLSYCGVIDWRPGRIAASVDGATAEDVRLIARCLEARLFLVIDEDTEECLIRSWARFDGVLRHPRLAVSFSTAFAGVESETLSGVISFEANKLRNRSPELVAWSKPKVLEVLDYEQIDPRSRPLPEDPFPQGFGYGLTKGLEQTSGDVCLPHTPAPAPAPLTIAPEPSSRKRPTRPIPENWEPSQKHAQYASQNHLDLSNEALRFRNHAEANDRRCVNWNAAFNNWLDRAQPTKAATSYAATGKPEGW